MKLGAWLLALVLPIARKAMIALGLSVVTYTGIDAVFNFMSAYLQNSVGGVSGNVAMLAQLIGFTDLIGIILAAITTRLAMTQLTQWAKS